MLDQNFYYIGSKIINVINFNCDKETANQIHQCIIPKRMVVDMYYASGSTAWKVYVLITNDGVDYANSIML